MASDRERWSFFGGDICERVRYRDFDLMSQVSSVQTSNLSDFNPK